MKFIPLAFCILFGCSSAVPQEILDAVNKRDFKSARQLLEKNSQSARARDANGRTPLHVASKIVPVDLDLIRLLIEHGADVNARDNSGQTAVHVAAGAARKDVVALLLGSGADLNIADNSEKTPLSYAATTVPFGFSVAQDRKDTVKLLVDGGARVPLGGPESQRLIHVAASSAYAEMAERMIGQGVDLNTRNRDGGTLLHSASSGGLAPLIDILVKKGRLDLNSRNRYGLTPLHVAAILGNREVVECLLAAGADVNARCPAGRTALDYAGEAGFKELADWLGRRGADRGRFPVLQGAYLGQKKPGAVPEVFAPGIISTIFVEHGPAVFSPDGNAVYWSPLAVRNRKAGSTILSMRLEKGRWTAPGPVSFAGAFMDCFPALSSDGRRLYFDSNRAVSKDMPPEHRNTWFVEKVASGWSDPRPMGAPVNSGNENTQATVDSNGNLYFGSSREGGRGSFDIYVSRLVKGRYVEPENLGDTVNTSGLEYSPYVDPAGRYLLFCAGERPDSRGGMDLFVSFRDRDGSWMQAVNLGDRINTPDDEYWPAVSPDGRHLFFVSARTGNFDVYWVDASVIDAARPKNSR